MDQPPPGKKNLFLKRAKKKPIVMNVQDEPAAVLTVRTVMLNLIFASQAFAISFARVVERSSMSQTKTQNAKKGKESLRKVQQKAVRKGLRDVVSGKGLAPRKAKSMKKRNLFSRIRKKYNSISDEIHKTSATALVQYGGSFEPYHSRWLTANTDLYRSIDLKKRCVISCCHLFESIHTNRPYRTLVGTNTLSHIGQMIMIKPVLGSSHLQRANILCVRAQAQANLSF